MANKNNSSSVLETLDSVQNCNEQSSEPIFKTPSPFWNQDSVFRRPKHLRESTPDVATDAFTLYPYRCDVASISNPELSCVIGANQIHPSLSLNLSSSRYLTPSSKILVNDPNRLHSIGRGTSYLSYLTSEVGDGYAKGFRNLHGSQIDQFPAYYRGVVRDLRRDILSEDIKMGMETQRYSHWYHGPEKQRIIHRSKRDHEKLYVKNNPFLSSFLYTDSHKEYFKDSTENNHHQMLTLDHSKHYVPEESKWDDEKQTREELLVWRGNAEKHNRQTNSSTHSKSSSSALCVLHRFVEGSLVELEGGRLKRVEDLKMEDLEQCAELHPELRLRRLIVLNITPSHTPELSCLHVKLEHDHSQLSLEVSEGLPFFVCGRGWSSCNPQHTSQTCRLHCHQLKVGDMCLALTHVPAPPAQTTNPSPAEVSSGHMVPKCETEIKTTLLRKNKSRKRHLTAPELREISKIYHIKD
ncbi:uncharacterized protein LOC127427653 [Myxocyprinus asiaticus]|uniref:uncharacterized protein LOC127427653 n=1 Tax=Myxocyprinus asiaticus TaxID=70543 RepID=UPI0022212FB9|nr:uncharacterized protein LOC127427653 [Myxocyprinus asiaticus]XP_051531318.1 uncharacterized protein LOC127427653 [Myxocyprinus asiaticus]